MKKIILLALILLCIESFAQKPSQKIIIQQGQKIIIEEQSNAQLSISLMGQEVEVTSENKSTTLLEVKQTANNNNLITSTLKKIKITSQAMGKSESYDSENELDKNSEIGKQFEKKLNYPEDITVDDKGQEINKKEVEELNPSSMAEMYGMANGNNVSSAFLIIPKNAKENYSWTDSSTIDSLTIIKNYTIKSINNSEANIQLQATIKGVKVANTMGMDMNVNIDTKINSELTSDINTGLVKKNISTTEMNNSVDMMGTSSPMTGKVNTTITYASEQ